jgi:hypothetical protein
VLDDLQTALTRRALVERALVGGVMAFVARLSPAAAWAATDQIPPRLHGLTISNGGAPFDRDHNLLSTLSQLESRRTAFVHFGLDRVARVSLEAVATRQGVDQVVWSQVARLRAGRHRLSWTPDPALPPRTYLLRLTVMDKHGRRRVYGPNRPYVAWAPRAPVVRILGVDATFDERSYAPGERAKLRVECDAAKLTLQLFRSGPELTPTFKNDEMNGIEVSSESVVDWSNHRDEAGVIKLVIGEWRSGVYFARLAADDGRVGFAPFIVRPARLGTSRVAVVLPTNTWQAYNFSDSDGDGWGDTWYAGGSPPVTLDRHHLNRGVPHRFRSYDLAFIRWLDQTGKVVDYLSEEDVERFRGGEELASFYDLIVFAGHTEYVTERLYDFIERYRDLGGNLMFLSANNFFWKVERRKNRIVRKQLWRNAGRPEARLIGIQYLANDDGTRQAPFVVTGEQSMPWAFEGTGLKNGDAFGVYGIEIDAAGPDSPPGTLVLAAMPDVFGPGRTAQMSYYETAAGAKVFAAGALNFGGSVLPVGRIQDPRITKVLENLWARLSVP